MALYAALKRRSSTVLHTFSSVVQTFCSVLQKAPPFHETIRVPSGG
jgi:hypothetical protein